MNDEARPRVLIVDDVPAIIRLLELELGIQGFVTKGANVGDDTFRAIEELKPSVIILEMILPGMSGLEMLKELKRRYDIPVMVLTTLDNEADRAEAYDLGADDYVQKPFDPLELGRRVVSLTRGGHLERRFFRAGDLRVDLTRQVARRGSFVLSLTVNEWAVLLALARRPGEVFSMAELGSMIGGDQPAMRPSVLWPVIQRLRANFGEDADDPQILAGSQEEGVSLRVQIEEEDQR